MNVFSNTGLPGLSLTKGH